MSATAGFLPLGQTQDNTSNAFDALLGEVHKFPNPNGLGENTYRLVENVSGITLASKRALLYASGFINKKVDGYCNVEADPIAGIVDDQLPATGVPNLHVFWLFESGQHLCITSLAADAGNLIAADTILVAATAATSQAVTAGRVKAADFTGATLPLAKQVFNAIARAVSAKTTANTGVDILARSHFK